MLGIEGGGRSPIGEAQFGRVAFDGRETPPLLPPDRPHALIRALAALHRGLLAYPHQRQGFRR